MKTVKRTVLFSLIGLLVIGGAGYWVVQDLFMKDDGEIRQVAEKIEQRETNVETVEAASGEKEAGGSPDMAEERVQIFLHRMTHQKIVAGKKIGAVEMTDANIADMMKIVTENSEYYEHSDFYLQTLQAWEKGDFSNAASIHNTIWTWHGGTVGRATGLMSEEQEAEFVEQHFR